ncbi:CDP-glycerol glycerophosphotransferase family protein, partial [Vibrio breoganii]
MDKNKYIVKRFLDLIFGVMLSFLFMFGKRKNRIIFNSVLNKNFDNNSKYYFLYLLRNHCKYELKFVVNDDRQRTDAISRYGEHFITSRGIKNKIYILNAKYWITSSLETPVGGVFLRKNRKVINLGHGMPYKLVGLQERNLSKLKKV